MESATEPAIPPTVLPISDVKPSIALLTESAILATESSPKALATPLTYLAVNYLKKKESVDAYDYDTDFSPFSVKTG